MQTQKLHKMELPEEWPEWTHDLVWDVADVYRALLIETGSEDLIAPMIVLANNVDVVFGRLGQTGVFMYIAEQINYGTGSAIQQLRRVREAMSQVGATAQLVYFNKCVDLIRDLGYGDEERIDGKRLMDTIRGVANEADRSAFNEDDDWIDIGFWDEGYELYGEKFKNWASIWRDKSTGNWWAEFPEREDKLMPGPSSNPETT